MAVLAEYKAPFPYFGGKSRIASEVWGLIGNVPNYVEPFFGSGAVFFLRPHEPGIETVNDADGFVSNFWRAVQSDPEGVAGWADNPVFENDLHARHVWLRAQADGLVPRLEADPGYFDPKIAGWWAWGMSCWIGTGFCAESGAGPWVVEDGRLVKGGAGRGVHRKLPNLGDAGQGVSRQLPHLGGAGKGVCRPGTRLAPYFSELAGRLSGARVCSGDWSRVVGPAVTVRHGTTGVFLDPPYRHEGRDTGVYRLDEDAIASSVEAWCRENGDNPDMRIVLCGYEGDYELPGWREIPWKANGGYGNQGHGRGRENSYRERIWASPHCLARNQECLF